MAFTSQTANLLHRPDANSLRSFIQKMKQQHLSVPKAEEETFSYVAPENLQSLETQTGMIELNKERTLLSCGTFQRGWVLSTTFRGITERQPPRPAGEQQNCWMVGERVFALEVWKQQYPYFLVYSLLQMILDEIMNFSYTIQMSLLTFAVLCCR